jgi:hypothetical protein
LCDDDSLINVNFTMTSIYVVYKNGSGLKKTTSEQQGDAGLPVSPDLHHTRHAPA